MRGAVPSELWVVSGRLVCSADLVGEFAVPAGVDPHAAVVWLAEVAGADSLPAELDGTGDGVLGEVAHPGPFVDAQTEIGVGVADGAPRLGGDEGARQRPYPARRYSAGCPERPKSRAR